MRKGRLLALFIMVQFVISGTSIAGSGSVTEFIAVLDGENQIPRRETPATGKVVFKLDGTERKMKYKLTVTDIENAVAAHIHLGKPGENGPIVATLAGPFPPGKGRKDGLLSEGTLEVSDLVGPLMALPRGSQHQEDDDLVLAELLAVMQNGDAYVSIHTDLGWGPAQIRPGNFPEGEIRGQIRTASE
jgi:hypothetical protein